MSSNYKVRWSPHSTPDKQQFLLINSKEHEITLYNTKPYQKGRKLTYELVSKHTKISYIRTFDWSLQEEDLICVGQSSGEALLLRIGPNARPSDTVTLAVKHQRACNSVSFSSNNLVAAGLDKVRNDFCLNIWDIRSAGTTSKPTPVRQLASSDGVSSVKFFSDQPNQIMAGVGYKWVRIYDLRDSPNNPAFSAASRHVHGLYGDSKDPNYFASYSDDGAVVVWDRRMGKSQTLTEPVLTYGRNSTDENNLGSTIISLRYSPDKSGVFGLLNSMGGLKIYQNGKMYESYSSVPSPTEAVHSHHKAKGKTKTPVMEEREEAAEILFTKRVIDITSPSPVSVRDEKSRHIATFDWHTDGTSQGLKMICMRQNGELQVHTLPGEPVSLAFGSKNTFITGSHGDSRVYEPLLRKEIITQPRYGVGRGSEIQITPSRGAFATTPPDVIDHSKSELMYPSSYIINPRDTLGNDVCLTMRRRAAKGYAMDAQSTRGFADDPDLEDMWTWLKGAEEAAENGGMISNFFDLSYLGVYGIWTGDLGECENTRLPNGPLRQKQRIKELANSAHEINVRNKRDEFRFQIATDFPQQRRLCLAIAGWDFPTDELETRLQELERTGQHAKAAGWALFHHNIKRCIKALTKGGQEMKLMSTAVAGYCAHTKGGREETSSSGAVWKELCRSMSVEMDDPYLRAVFAFVANGDWKDVLDDAGLPIKEKLGIAFRFLRDEELSNYITSLLEDVIRDGDLTGLLLTGISDKALDLLQKYVNRTADVQTAALVSAFAVPRYFTDDRVDHWVQSYRWLLNSWKMFLTRARYDVMRSMKAKERGGPGIPAPPQVSLRCVSCDKNFTPQREPLNPPLTSTLAAPSTRRLGGTNAGGAATRPQPQQPPKSIVCPHCNKPLPRCAVCLLHLGTPVPIKGKATKEPKPGDPDPRSDPPGTREVIYDTWFTWCMSCNHGLHSVHAREWFQANEVCPVPGCDCECANK